MANNEDWIVLYSDEVHGNNGSNEDIGWDDESLDNRDTFNGVLYYYDDDDDDDDDDDFDYANASFEDVFFHAVGKGISNGISNGIDDAIDAMYAYQMEKMLHRHDDLYEETYDDDDDDDDDDTYEEVDEDSYEVPHKKYAKSSSAHSYTAAPKAERKFKLPWQVTLAIIVIAVTALGIYEVTKLIPMQYAADALVGNTYNDVARKLKKAGFSVVWSNEIADLPASQISKEYVVTEVEIGWNSTFSETTKMPSNLPVIVTYHTLKKARVPMTNKEAKGTNYKDVQTAFKNAGFSNIKTEVKYDILLGWFTKDGEVDSVTVGGDKEYEAGNTYKVNTKVVITYHTFRKNKP